MPIEGPMVGDRTATYRRMVTARRICRECAGLTNGSVIGAGKFDSAEIGPWTRWLGDLSARVLVVGQDWGDQRAFTKQEGRNDPSATNTMLRSLLASVGVPVPDVDQSGRSSGVFLTNAVLCFKDNGCQGPVRAEWFQNCGPRFLRPQIELINPRVIICLGERAYTAMLSAYRLPKHNKWRAVVEGPGVHLAGGPIAFGVYHCGRRILNTHRDEAAQFRDWQRIARALQ